MSATLRFLVGTFVVGAIATACSTPSAPTGTCPDDQACADGFVCAFGLCLDPDDQRLSTVDIEIDGGEGIPVQTEFAVNLKARPRVDITLAPGVVVSGAVVRPTVEGSVPVDAVVVAQPPQSVPGRVLAPSATTNADGLFDFLAVQGLDYALTVSPSASDLPPVYDDNGFEADPDAGNQQSLGSITVEPGAITLSGVVRAGEGAAEQGIEALEVRVTDTVGKESSGRRVSSSTRTAADGTFTLTLRDPGVYALEVLPTVDNQPYPRVSTQIDVTEVDGEVIELAPISLGAVLTPQGFEARVVDSDGNPVAGATLSVRGAVGNGEVTAIVVADANGNLSSSALPPATYEALVYGPAESTAGLLVRDDLDVPSSNADLVFTLPRRVSFNGSVVDPDGADLAGASITFLRVADVDGERAAVLNDTVIQFAGASDASGQFDVPVDPGQYRVTVKPPVGVAAPVSSELHTVTEQGLRRDLTLPARAFVVGVVTGPNGPVPSAYVRVFSTLVDEVRGAAIVLGEGVAGPDGSFEIVVSDLVGPQAPDPP